MGLALPIAMGVGSLISGLFTNQQNVDMQRETNQQNYWNMIGNQKFQADMSNTAYQRGTADLKAAGLNPALAYMSSQASTPSGSMSVSQAPRIENNLANAMSTAMDVARFKNETELAESQSNLNTANSAAAAASAKKSIADAISTHDENMRKAGMYPSQKQMSDIQSRLMKDYGETDKILDMVQKGASSASHVVDVVAPLKKMFSTNKEKDGLWNLWKDSQKAKGKLP